jgi:hypothetical protein
MKSTVRAPMRGGLPRVKADAPKPLTAFAGQLYTPDVHNQMRDALKMSGLPPETDLDKIISEVVPDTDLTRAIAFEAAKKILRMSEEKPTGPTAVERLCDLFVEMGIPHKPISEHPGDYIVADGKGKMFSLIDAFIEVVRRMRAAEARLAVLEQQSS